MRLAPLAPFALRTRRPVRGVAGLALGDWRAELEARGISVTMDVLRDEAIAVYEDYGRSNALVYNARGTGSRL